MKKILTMILLGVMCIGLTGCRNNEEEPSPGNNNNNNQNISNNESYTAEELINKINDMYDTIDNMVVAFPMEEDLNNTDRIKELTSLNNLDNVELVISANPMITAIPYSFVLIRVNDDANIDAMKQEIYNNLDLNEWICVGADIAYITSVGNLIMFVMAERDLANEVYDAFVNEFGQTTRRLEKVNTF